MRHVLLVVSLVASSGVLADVPDWYKRDIGPMIHQAKSVVVYRAIQNHRQKANGPYWQLTVSSSTVEVLKGTAPPSQCYTFQVEGKPEPMTSGEAFIAIYSGITSDGCGGVEPGHLAPGTDEYINLFRSVIKAPNQSFKSTSSPPLRSGATEV